MTLALPTFDPADAELRDQYEAAERELRELVGDVAADAMIRDPGSVQQHGDDLPHYLLTLMCNRSNEATARAAYRRREASRRALAADVERAERRFMAAAE